MKVLSIIIHNKNKIIVLIFIIFIFKISLTPCLFNSLCAFKYIVNNKKHSYTSLNLNKVAIKFYNYTLTNYKIYIKIRRNYKLKRGTLLS